MNTQNLPLSRFRVLDLSRVRAGPTAVRQLGDWGADVIKIELPARVQEDDGYTGARHAADFQNLHRNKRSLTLDLKSPEGKEILFRLVAKADVVVENFRPDVKHRLGIDYEAMSAINPRIVYGSISGFGQDGPYAQRPGVDQIAQGMSGFMSVTGHAGQGPMRAGAAIADVSSGLYLALGILTALLEREVSGRGQFVSTSLLEAQIGVLDFQAAAWLFDRKVPKQAGNNHPKTIPTGLFETKDGHINIGSGNQKRWKALTHAMGAPHLTEKPGFDSPEARRANRDEVNAALTEIFVTKTSAEWVEILNRVGIPCGPVYTIDQAFDDPQVRHTGIATPVDHPKLGKREIVGQPIHMSRTPWQVRSVTPEVGEHTGAILKELGYDEAAIESLRARHIV